MTQYARPDADITKGSWTVSTGTTFWAVLDETSAGDTDYVQRLGGDDTFEVGLSDVTDPQSSSNHVVSVRARKQGAGAVNGLTAYLMQGTTQIASFAVSYGSSFATTTYTLTGAQADAITDYTALRVRVALDWGSGVGTGVQVSWIELALPDAPGGSTTPQGVSGSLTAAGGLAIEVRRGVAGSATASGGLLRQSARVLGGAATASGSATRRVQVTLGGSVTLSALLALTRVFLLSLIGALTPGGLLNRRAGKLLSGSATASGTPGKRIGKGLTSASTPTGALSRRSGKGQSGVIAPAGSAGRRTGKGVAGTAPATGGLLRSTSKGTAGASTPAGGLGRLIGKGLGGSLSLSGLLDALKGAQTFLVSLAGQITASAALRRRVAQNAGGEAGPVGTVQRRTALATAGSITPVGLLGRLRLMLLAIAGSLTPAGALGRLVGLGVGGSALPSGELRRGVLVTLRRVLTPLGTRLAQLLSSHRGYVRVSDRQANGLTVTCAPAGAVAVTHARVTVAAASCAVVNRLVGSLRLVNSVAVSDALA